MAKRPYAYMWVSPRGFSNEGTIYQLTEEELPAFLEHLDQRYGADPNARYYRMGYQEARGKFGACARVYWEK